MAEFSDKVALVTGAGRGIGREIARALAALGANIAANDIAPLNLDETIELIHQSGAVAKPYVFDIAKRMPIEGMVTQVLEHFGHIDILVNHASVYPDAALLEMDEWEYHRTLDVNLGGPYFAMQQVGRAMQQQGGGTIINLISSGGQVELKKGGSAITASQAGLIGLTISAAEELAVHKIRVNAVCYGLVLPGILPSASVDKSAIGAWRKSRPQIWLGEHPDLVSAVLYLCSKDGSAVTGKVIIINHNGR